MKSEKMKQKTWFLIEKISLIYSPIIIFLIFILTIVNQLFYFILVIAFFVYAIELIFVGGIAVYESLLNKNFEETEKI